MGNTVTIDQTVLETQAQSANALVPVDNTAFVPASTINDVEIKAAMDEINLNDTNSITTFGFKASQAATAVSQEMIEGVRNKDTGPVGDIMNDMMLELRGLDPDSMNGGGMFGWLKKHATRVAQFGQKFETVQHQIESMKGNLLKHQSVLMASVANMDRLYDKTEVQFHELEVYIIAGERIIEDMNARDIPAMKAIVDAQADGPDGTPAALMPQKFADLQAKRDQLERKVHDLKLVRMVTLQAMPKIRLTQDSDNSLIQKIGSIITTTIPIWYQEMAIAIEQAKTQKAANAVNNVTDATNEMLTRGADQFKQATISAREAVEKSVVGIDAVKYQNEKIIETINEALQITRDGKAARAEADKVLKETESALRAALEANSDVA